MTVLLWICAVVGAVSFTVTGGVLCLTVADLIGRHRHGPFKRRTHVAMDQAVLLANSGAASKCECGGMPTAEPTLHTETVCQPLREVVVK